MVSAGIAGTCFSSSSHHTNLKLLTSVCYKQIIVATVITDIAQRADKRTLLLVQTQEQDPHQHPNPVIPQPVSQASEFPSLAARKRNSIALDIAPRLIQIQHSHSPYPKAAFISQDFRAGLSHRKAHAYSLTLPAAVRSPAETDTAQLQHCWKAETTNSGCSTTQQSKQGFPFHGSRTKA